MADQFPPRQPFSAEDSQDSSHRNSYETGADARQSIPQVSVPTRVQEGAMSPVRINFQNDEYAQPSTVQIENMTAGMRDSQIGSQSSYQGGSEGTIRQAARRQVYPEQGQRHASQAGVLSNMEGSPQPYNDERRPNGNGRNSDDSNSSGSVIQNVAPLPYYGMQRPDPNAQYDRSSGHEYPPGRHLTPISTNQAQNQARRSYAPRPQSTYSAYSDQPLNRGRSPGYSPAHENGPMRRTPEGSRPNSYLDLSGQYPQQAPPAFDNSDLRNQIGNNASLLSTIKTLQMYRDNLKKTTDPETHYSFALLLIDAAKEVAQNEPQGVQERKASPKLGRGDESPYAETSNVTSQDLIREARKILEQLAGRSFPYAQYYLGDGYFSGYFNKGKEDHAQAFQLFIAASKHGHAESSYRAALCYEFGWGTKKNVLKAQDFYRAAATKNHPGAMTRLGRAGLTGDLGEATEKEAIKWLQRATESADIQHNDAPFYLGQLYEHGFGDNIFKDESYAAQLFTQAADLGHSEAAFRLGEAYEHGTLGCPRDPSLSVHFYTMASAKGHPVAMFNLCAWYMVGAEPVLDKDEDEAYEWAKRAAEAGTLKKADFFSEQVLKFDDATFSSGLVKKKTILEYLKMSTLAKQRGGVTRSKVVLWSELVKAQDYKLLKVESAKFAKRVLPEESWYDGYVHFCEKCRLRHRFSSCKVAGVQHGAIEHEYGPDKYEWIGGWQQEVVLEAIVKFYSRYGVLTPRELWLQSGREWRYTHSAMGKFYTPVLEPLDSSVVFSRAQSDLRSKYTESSSNFAASEPPLKVKDLFKWFKRPYLKRDYILEVCEALKDTWKKIAPGNEYIPTRDEYIPPGRRTWHEMDRTVMRFLFDEPTKSFPEMMSLESRHRLRTPSGSFVDLREYLRRGSVATALSTASLPKAEYAIGYFTEMGIGCRRDPLEANVWYVKAAEKGEQRAIERLKRIADAAEGGSITGKGGRKLDLKNLGGAKKDGKGEGKRISSRELKRKTEELKLANGQGGLPKRSSSLPQAAMELQLPLSPSSGNVNGGGEKLVKTPGTPGKDKECVVM